MTHGGLLASGVGIALAALLLTGCTAQPAPTDSALPSVPPASSTPSATAAPAVATKPGSRVPVGCTNLLDTDGVKAIAGPKITVDQDENSHPTDLAPVAQLQFGALTCMWDGLGRGSDVTREGSELTVSVAPDSKDAFDSRFSAIMAMKGGSGHPAPTLDVAGDKSGFWCANELEALGSDSNLVICDGEMLVSGYWVGVTVDTVDGISRAQLTRGITDAMKQMATKLEAAGPAIGQWVAPATTPPTLCTSSTSTAKVRTIFADSSLVRHMVPAAAVYASTIGSHGTMATCYWASTTGSVHSVDLLAGGSWAFGELQPKAPGDSAIRGPFIKTTIPGASAALIACAGTYCDSYLAVGTTAVEIFTSTGMAKSRAELAAWAKLIAGS